MIEEGRVMVSIIPDIESVNYGRGVGYEIIEHIPPEDIKEISATKIREKLKMISINDKFLLSDDICERIKLEYKDKLTLIKSDIRQQKNYHELDDKSWLFNEIEN